MKQIDFGSIAPAPLMSDDESFRYENAFFEERKRIAFNPAA